MAVDPVNANAQFARCFKNCLIAGPFTAPLFVVTNTVQELLFRDLSGHPAIENVLTSGEYGLNSKRDIILFQLSNSLEQFNNVDLTFRQGVLITDYDQSSVVRRCYQNNIHIS